MNILSELLKDNLQDPLQASSNKQGIETEDKDISSDDSELIRPFNNTSFGRKFYILKDEILENICIAGGAIIGDYLNVQGNLQKFKGHNLQEIEEELSLKPPTMWDSGYIVRVALLLCCNQHKFDTFLNLTYGKNCPFFIFIFIFSFFISGLLLI